MCSMLVLYVGAICHCILDILLCSAAHSASASALHHHADAAVTSAFVASIPGWLEQSVPSLTCIRVSCHNGTLPQLPEYKLCLCTS